MSWINSIWKFLIDPKNRRMFIFAALVIFGLLFFRQCNQIKGLKDQIKTEQAEQERIKNNYDASQDTVEMYRTENGSLRGEIDGYVLTVEEMKGEYAHLFGEYEKEKNKPPKTIIKYKTKIVEVIKEVPVYISIDSLGNKYFTFNDTAIFEEGNSRILSGFIPYKLNYYSLPDSTLQHPDSIPFTSKVFPGMGNFKLTQNISLTTGLSIDNTTKKPLIWVETKYPGVTFPTITGAYIMDESENKKALRKLRKEFGVSAQFGYGLMFTKDGYNTGFYVGGGISYTPRWLQFGK